MLRTAIAIVALVAAMAPAGMARAQDGEPSLDEMVKKLNNPLSDIWLLFVENHTASNRGFPAESREWTNTFLVEPLMPLALTEKWNLVTRPILPIISAPRFEGRGVPDDFNDCPGFCEPGEITPGLSPITSDRKFGTGDLVVWQQLSPSKPMDLPDGSKLSWGLGYSWRFPTASIDQFGADKYALGPSALFIRVPGQGGKWTLGLFQQHHFSFAGSGPDRVTTSDFQPIYWYKLPWGQWQVGGFPVISVNWEASSGNKLTLPLEVVFNNTFRMGDKTARFGFGFQYSLVSPDDYGKKFMFKLFFVPVIPKPIQRALFSG